MECRFGRQIKTVQRHISLAMLSVTDLFALKQIMSETEV
uniref:Uncharacterized protein n=1 Tax=Rhizophora mucronata TaxID=61149 RepID=A0A2P2PB34_RHIMU